MSVASAILLALGRLALVLLVVTVGVVLLLKLSPIDPVKVWAGPAMMRLSPERQAEIAALWGHDLPIWQQLWLWAKALLGGDLGHSVAYGAPVAEVIRARIGPTLLLGGLAWLISGVAGLGLGALAGLWAGGPFDRTVRLICLTLAATPAFWLGMVGLAVFSVQLGWTPICCAGPLGLRPHEVPFGARLWHLALPLAVLCCFGISQVALHTRLKMIEVLAMDPVIFARAQGAGDWDILRHHGLRNALLPAVAVMFTGMGELIGGTILAEQVFAWPGLGRASVEAGMLGDLPLLLAIALLTALVVASGNMLADLLAKGLDPRLRRSL